MGDYNFNKTLTISYDILRDWTQRLYMAVGMNEKDAYICADSAVMTDARGVYSHGCMRTKVYTDRILHGGTSATAQPSILRERCATAVVDGNNAMGQVSGVYAMKIAIEKAKIYGTSSVSITHGNHFGTCAYFSEMAAREDMIGFVWTNGGPTMAPWGGAERQLGNNPFSIAVPCRNKHPVVLDMAQSVVARGKIVMARKTNSPIPDNWSLDVDGRPTTDADAGYWGTVRPIADYKGYALTYMVSIISAILPNTTFGPNLVDLYEELSVVNNTGQFIQVVDISAFSDVDEFKNRMDDSVDYLKNGKKAPGVKEILVPGEPEFKMLEKQLAEGITIAEEIVEEYMVMSKKFGVEPPVAFM